MYWYPAASSLCPRMALGGWHGPAQPETPDVARSSIIPGMTMSKPCHGEPQRAQILGCSGTSGGHASNMKCLLWTQRGYKHPVV